MKKLEPLVIRDFSKGIDHSLSTYLFPNQLKYSLNFYNSISNNKLGSLTSRYPTYRFFNYISSNSFIIGLHCDTINSLLAAATNGTTTYVYAERGSGWVNTGAAPFDWANPTKQIRFIQYLGYTFACNGVYIKSWDGVLANNWGATNLTSAPTGSLIKEYQGRVYVSGNTTNTSRVFYSGLPSAGVLPTWDTTNNFFDVTPNDGDKITAIEVCGSSLYIFKNRSVYIWDGSSLYLVSKNVGAVTQETVQVIGNTIFFTGENSNGPTVNMITGGEVQNIDLPINDYIINISSTTMFVLGAFADNLNYYLSVSDITLYENDISNSVTNLPITSAILAYNILTKTWSPFNIEHLTSSIVSPYGNNFFPFATKYIVNSSSNVSDENYIVIGGGSIGNLSNVSSGLSPVIWNYNVSNPSTIILGDNYNSSTASHASPINLLLQWEDIDFGSRSRKKQINKFNVFADGNYGILNLFMKVDNGSWQSLGALTGKTTTFSPGKQGYKFGFKLVGSNSGNRVIFEGFEFFNVTIEDYPT